MNDQEIQNKLKQIVFEHGGAELYRSENKTRFSGLIADYFHDNEGVKKLLQQAISQNIALKILQTEHMPLARRKQQVQLIVQQFIKENFLNERVEVFIRHFATLLFPETTSTKTAKGGDKVEKKNITVLENQKSINPRLKMGKAIEITDANFEEVVSGDQLVLVDFWAEWCGPCKMIGPIIEELAGDYEGKAVIGKVDVDSNPAVAQAFGIRSIPTLLFFKGGQIVDKQVGAVPKSVLTEKLNKQL